MSFIFDSYFRLLLNTRTCKVNTQFIKYNLVLFFTPCFFTPVYSQIKFTDNLYIRTDYHFGAVIPEYTFVNYLVNDYVKSMEVSIAKESSGVNYWAQLYHYPTYGLALNISTLGNNEVFGKQIALSLFYQIHLQEKKNLSLDYKVGLGAAYLTKKFSINDNYQNIAVGSHLNINFNIGLEGKIHLKDKIYFHTGLTFHHFSNAMLSEPNLGLNYLTASCGFSYLIGVNQEKIIHEIEPYQPGNEFQVIYAYGLKHPRALQSKLYYTSSLSLEYNRKLFYKFHLGIGSDLLYDSSTKVDMEIKGLENYEANNDFKSGIHLSEEFVYHNTSIILQEGVYILLTDKVNNYKIYNRGIVRQKLTDHLFVNVSMKSHLQILDYPEFGIGYFW